MATVDLARLVNCVACPSDRLEMHLDIEGAEYEVCYTDCTAFTPRVCPLL